MPSGTPPPNPLDDPAHTRAILAELVTLGMSIARDLAREQAVRTDRATAALPGPAEPVAAATPDPAAAFERVSRAVRRTLLLARRLAEAEANPAHPTPGPAEARATTRRRIIREVEDAIHRATNDPAAADSLQTELAERLDAPELDDDITARPPADIITDIVRDLGLDRHAAQPWRRRTPAQIRTLHSRAAAGAAPGPAPAPAPAPGPGRTYVTLAPIPAYEPDPAALTLLRPPPPNPQAHRATTWGLTSRIRRRIPPGTRQPHSRQPHSRQPHSLTRTTRGRTPAQSQYGNNTGPSTGPSTEEPRP